MVWRFAATSKSCSSCSTDTRLNTSSLVATPSPSTAPRVSRVISTCSCGRRSENAERILAALDDFGFGSLNLSKGDFTTPGMVVQLGVPPVRIDIITRVSGVPWEKADADKVPGRYAETPVFFIGREDFIANKRATGRAKDAADVEALGGQ